ncbi:MAG: Gfo/Idh/MocA family oxidoreductase [Ruminococcaceae bacterium]|nr:Gfo/Idh/MocA family oxidoreductase [Oscillospiraceae bacterium]
MKIGLVGFGYMGKSHAYAVHNLRYFYGSSAPDAAIVGVTTNGSSTAQEACRDYALGRVYETVEEMLCSSEIDIIDVCSPNLYHYDTVKRALLAGKHVYCEKPLAVTAAQANELATLAASRGVTAQVVFNNRFLTGVMAAKRLIDEGRLGRIVSFRSAYLHASCTDLSRPAGWKQDKTVCGGGVLFDLGSHALDLVRYLCGEFAEISGRAQIAHPSRVGRDGKPWQTNAEEAFYMTAALQNGAVGTIEANKLALGTNDDLSFEIYGESGALRYSLMQPSFLSFYDNTRPGGVLGGERGFTSIECVSRFPAPGGIFPAIKAPTGWLMGHVGSMYAFLSAVSAKREASPSFADGARIQQIMEAAYTSASDNGRIVRL